MPIHSETFSLPFACAEDDELILIGDVHGCANQLEALLDQVAEMPTAPGRRRKLIFLGDLIDRGPASLRALDLAIGAKDRTGADEVIGLMGNHEQMLKIALIDEDDPISKLAADIWLGNGGTRVIGEIMEANPGRSLDVPSSLGADRVAWLDGLVSHHISGQILAVHAGVHPMIPLDGFLAAHWAVNFRQFREEAHWAWVRAPFLDHMPAPGDGHHGHFVVHGHTTPSHDRTSLHAQIARSRLNLDGGSFASGEVRMARIVGTDCTLFLAR